MWLLRAGDKGLQNVFKKTFLTVRKERTVPHVSFFWRTMGLVLCLETAITQHYKNDTFWAVQQINLVILTMLKLEYKSFMLRSHIKYICYSKLVYSPKQALKKVTVFLSILGLSWELIWMKMYLYRLNCAETQVDSFI